MTLKDFINMLDAVHNNVPFKLSYRLLSGLKFVSLNDFIHRNGGPLELKEFLQEILDAEPPDFS
jgi:hypothetical protein